MTTTSVTLERPRPAFAKLWINRPDKRNAFDADIIETLLHQFTELADDPSLRVIQLGGKGNHFSAGADLGWMRQQGQQSFEENRQGAACLAKLLQQIDQQPQVVIARVQGAAFGGALGLICAAHIAIGADNLRFCLSEARLGLLPAMIAPYVVRAMGGRQARRYMSSCELIEADTATRLGLVHETTSLDTLDERCNALAEQLCQVGPSAQRQVPALIQRVSGPIDSTMIDATCELIATLRKSDEGQEGMAAFLEKRPPAWAQTGTDTDTDTRDGQ